MHIGFACAAQSTEWLLGLPVLPAFTTNQGKCGQVSENWRASVPWRKHLAYLYISTETEVLPTWLTHNAPLQHWDASKGKSTMQDKNYVTRKQSRQRKTILWSVCKIWHRTGCLWRPQSLQTSPSSHQHARRGSCCQSNCIQIHLQKYLPSSATQWNHFIPWHFLTQRLQEMHPPCTIWGQTCLGHPTCLTTQQQPTQTATATASCTA